MEKSILIIEDDKEISGMISEYLIKNGYKTIDKYNGIEGVRCIKNNKIDLIILDVMLPYKSGDEVLREIRLFSDIPVIVVSAKDMVQAKVDLFKLGADDYVTKPFSLVELLARIEVNLNRYCKSEEKIEYLVYKDINLNKFTKEVSVHGSDLVLTSKEYKILELMMKNPSKVFSKKNLYESVWNEIYDYCDEDRVNTHISNLRKKLKAKNNIDYIQTVWGMGYKLI